MSGVADDDSADETVVISHQVTSHDGKYAVIPVSTVAVAVTEPAQQQKQVSSDATPEWAGAVQLLVRGPADAGDPAAAGL